MRNKKVVFILVLLLAALTLSTYAETKKLKSIGHYTLVRVREKSPPRTS